MHTAVLNPPVASGALSAATEPPPMELLTLWATVRSGLSLSPFHVILLGASYFASRTLVSTFDLTQWTNTLQAIFYGLGALVILAFTMLRVFSAKRHDLNLDRIKYEFAEKAERAALERKQQQTDLDELRAY